MQRSWLLLPTEKQPSTLRAGGFRELSLTGHWTHNAQLVQWRPFGKEWYVGISGKYPVYSPAAKVLNPVVTPLAVSHRAAKPKPKSQ